MPMSMESRPIWPSAAFGHPRECLLACDGFFAADAAMNQVHPHLQDE
jgi:hypothetical protein